MLRYNRVIARHILFPLFIALFLAPLMWFIFCIFLGLFTFQEMGNMLAHPLSAVFIIGFIILDLVGMHYFVRKTVELADSDDENAGIRCARRIRFFIVAFLLSSFGFCTLGISLALSYKEFQVPMLGFQAYGLGIGTNMLCTLPPGVSAFIWLEKRTGKQRFDSDYIPMSLTFRIAFLGMFIALGILLTIIASAVTVAHATEGEFHAVFNKLSTVGLFSILFSAINVYQLHRIIIQPINKLRGYLEQGMNGDLTIRCPRTSWDELGLLSIKYNDFMASLQSTMSGTLGITKDLAEAGNALKESVEVTEEAVSHIGSAVGETNDGLEAQRANLLQTTGAVEEIAQNILSLDRSIEQQAANVGESSAAITQMVANTASIQNIVHESADSVSTLQQSSETGKEELAAMNDAISSISGASSDLLAANDMISNIAAQTSLLSMNAAIEAAHAGEAGKGFAVVADEIRKLAESSTQQSESIAKTLKTVITDITTVVNRFDSATTRFDAIYDEVRKVAQINSEITNAMEEQQRGGDEIVKALAVLSDITGEVQNGSREMKNGNQDILSAVTDLNTITVTINERMALIRTGSETIAHSVKSIVENEVKNAQNISACGTAVSRFRIS
ncbi:MAG: methyl-accepting chemotaxis protein [Spirochaetales bacterium]|nr:methyl-accepting chemotaxis protein [Spirochaetales bacterium]